MERTVFLAALVYSLYGQCICASQANKSMVVAIDLGLLMPNEDMSTIITNAVTNGLPVIARHPSLLTKILHIVEIGKRVGQTTRGMSNIISQVSNEIEGEFRVRLNPEEQKGIIAISVAPVIKSNILSQLKTLKALGSILIGFTNRDNYELQLCRDIIQKNNQLDVQDLFAGIVSLQCSATVQDLESNNICTKSANYRIAREPFPQDAFIADLAQLISPAQNNTDVLKICIFPQRVYDTTSNAQIIATFKNNFPAADVHVAVPPTKENKETYDIVSQVSAFSLQDQQNKKTEGQRKRLDSLD